MLIECHGGGHLKKSNFTKAQGMCMMPIRKHALRRTEMCSNWVKMSLHVEELKEAVGRGPASTAATAPWQFFLLVYVTVGKLSPLD